MKQSANRNDAACSFESRLLERREDLLKYAIVLTNDPHEAEDLLHDTYIRALQNKGKYVNDENFFGWISTIMRNLSLNKFERKSRYREIFDKNADVTDTNIQLEEPHYTPEGDFHINEINDAITRLKDISRKPLRLFIEGNTYQDIAEKLNLPLGTVKSRLHIAKKELQKQLTGYEKS